jgi:hypothetical protein
MLSSFIKTTHTQSTKPPPVDDHEKRVHAYLDYIHGDVCALRPEDWMEYKRRSNALIEEFLMRRTDQAAMFPALQQLQNPPVQQPPLQNYTQPQQTSPQIPHPQPFYPLSYPQPQQQPQPPQQPSYQPYSQGFRQPPVPASTTTLTSLSSAAGSSFLGQMNDFSLPSPSSTFTDMLPNSPAPSSTVQLNTPPVRQTTPSNNPAVPPLTLDNSMSSVQSEGDKTLVTDDKTDEQKDGDTSPSP